MNLTDLNHNSTAYKKRKRRGRGEASGLGKTSGRGHKGQRSRSGFSRRPHFEGGQMPLFRRIAKRGFNNVFKTYYDIVNVGDLNAIEGVDTVDHAALVKAGLIKKRHGRLKVLGDGKLEKKLVVEAARFSEGARRQIEDLGGQAKTV